MAVDRRGNIVGILKIVRLKVRPAMHRIHVRSRTGKATFPMDTDGMFTYVEHTMRTALDHLTKLADDAHHVLRRVAVLSVTRLHTVLSSMMAGGNMQL